MTEEQKPKILAVEDNIVEHYLLESLLSASYDVTFAATVEQAVEFLNTAEYSLVLLDAILPDGTGFELCQKIRQEMKLVDLPIIFITGKTSTSDLLAAFSVGADDFVTKPYNQLELTARIKAKMPKGISTQLPLKQGPLEINQITQRVYLDDNGNANELDIKGHEYHLLVYFMKHPDHVLSREQILNSVWGNKVSVNDRTIDTHVSKLKKKLGTAKEFIESVHGQGYRFKAHMSHVQKAS